MANTGKIEYPDSNQIDSTTNQSSSNQTLLETINSEVLCIALIDKLIEITGGTETVEEVIGNQVEYAKLYNKFKRFESAREEVKQAVELLVNSSREEDGKAFAESLERIIRALEKIL